MFVKRTYTLQKDVHLIQVSIFLMQWRWCAIHTFILNKLTASIVFVYVIARARMKLNFTSCSENGNCSIIATTSGIYPKLSLLPVLSQINIIASFIKVIIPDFQTRFNDEYALPTWRGTTVKVDNRSRLTFFVHRAEADSLSS